MGRTPERVPVTEQDLINDGFTQDEVDSLNALKVNYPYIEFTDNRRQFDHLREIRWRVATGRLSDDGEPGITNTTPFTPENTESAPESSLEITLFTGQVHRIPIQIPSSIEPDETLLTDEDQTSMADSDLIDEDLGTLRLKVKDCFEEASEILAKHPEVDRRPDKSRHGNIIHEKLISVGLREIIVSYNESFIDERISILGLEYHDQEHKQTKKSLDCILYPNGDWKVKRSVLDEYGKPKLKRTTYIKRDDIKEVDENTTPLVNEALDLLQTVTNVLQESSSNRS